MVSSQMVDISEKGPSTTEYSNVIIQPSAFICTGPFNPYLLNFVF